MLKTGRIVLYLSLAVTGTYFAVIGLTAAKAFLAPIVIAVLLAMLVLPIADKLEGMGVLRGWASFWSDLLLVLATLAFFFIISAQIKLVADDWEKISDKFEPRIERAFDYIEDKTGVSLDEMFGMPSFMNTGSEPARSESGRKSAKDVGSNDQKAEQDNAANRIKPGKQKERDSGISGLAFSGREILSGVASSAAGVFGFLGSMMLVFIYVFFFLLYRNKLKESLLKLMPDDKRDRTSNIISNSAKVAKKYLTGKFLLIVFLAIFYSVGMLLLGVKYAVFAGIIAAILSLIPYIGNIVGGAVSILFASISGGSFFIILGVLGIFVVAQFVETYLLEPYIVGKQVELNPIMIIIIVIMGEAIWGVTGMVIAIPVTGIFKVIFDATPRTRPLGYLLGNEDISSGDGLFKKVIDRIKR